MHVYITFVAKKIFSILGYILGYIQENTFHLAPIIIGAGEYCANTEYLDQI